MGGISKRKWRHIFFFSREKKRGGGGRKFSAFIVLPCCRAPELAESLGFTLHVSQRPAKKLVKIPFFLCVCVCVFPLHLFCFFKRMIFLNAVRKKSTRKEFWRKIAWRNPICRAKSPAGVSCVLSGCNATRQKRGGVKRQRKAHFLHRVFSFIFKSKGDSKNGTMFSGQTRTREKMAWARCVWPNVQIYINTA